MIFTAEWCLNCKALEQSVWDNPELAKLVSRTVGGAHEGGPDREQPGGPKNAAGGGQPDDPAAVGLRPDGQPVLRSDFYTADQVVEAIRASLAASPPKP
ncbi:MAG: hypothetical protein MZU91_07930 [Desulfosudis oleivorans]|nr:hypothetical protein [Desulfosudis oleivorans]